MLTLQVFSSILGLFGLIGTCSSRLTDSGPHYGVC